MGHVKDVDEYIASAPKGAQPKLRELRTAIRAAAPNADESLSYGMPFYSYRGEVGVGARLCYFGLKTDGIGFYMRPKDFSNHLDKVAELQSSKSRGRRRLRWKSYRRKLAFGGSGMTPRSPPTL